VFWRVRCSSLLHALTLTIVTSHLPLLRQQTFLSPTLPAFSHPPQESTLTVHPSRSAAVMAPPAVPPEVSLDKMSAELTTEIMSHIRPHDLTKLARASKRYRGFAQSALWRNIELPRRSPRLFRSIDTKGTRTSLPRQRTSRRMVVSWPRWHRLGLRPLERKVQYRYP
jgi:hypothetical protein